MADETNTIKGKYAVNQVNIRNKGGDPTYQNVNIAPFAKNVLVKKPSTEGTGEYTSLQDFLFGKFIDTETKITNSDNTTEIKAYRVRAGKKVGETVVPDYYSVNTNATSVWQAWNDYQEILKKRLVGVYDDNGTYKGDYINNNELQNTAGAEHQQAYYTLLDGNIKNAIEFIIDRYNLKDDIINGQEISAEEQARALLMDFGKSSFWQNILDIFYQQKQALLGIYDAAGECVGFFEDTANNREKIKEIYSSESSIHIINGEDSEGNTIQQEIYKLPITNDEELSDVLIDLSKKSVYQHLIDLKDFWMTLPIEYYGRTEISGHSIANLYDIQSLSFNPWLQDVFNYKYDNVLFGYIIQGYDDEYIGEGAYEEFCDLIIPDSLLGLPVVGIDSHAFQGKKFNSIVFPSSLKIIKRRAFYQCQTRESLTFPKGLTHIESEAFSELGSEVPEVAIPVTVELVGEKAFYNTAIKILKLDAIEIDRSAFTFDASDDTSMTIYIGTAVKNIGESAFEMKNVRVTVYYSGTIGQWCEIGFANETSNPCYTETASFYETNQENNLYQKLNSYVAINEGTKRIRNYALQESFKIQTLTIPSTVEEIEAQAFIECSELIKIDIYLPEESILGKPWGCTNENVNIVWNYQGTTQISLQYELTNEGCVITGTNEDFYATDLEIPESYDGHTVIGIGERAFKDVHFLEFVTIPESVKTISQEAFSGCVKLNQINIHPRVEKIGYHAFFNTGYYNNSKNWKNQILYDTSLNYLIDVNTAIKGAHTVQRGTRLIADYAFYDCKDLKQLTLPVTIEIIGDHAFDNANNSLHIQLHKIQNSVYGANWGASSAGWASATVGLKYEEIKNEEGVIVGKKVSGFSENTMPSDIFITNYNETDNDNAVIRVGNFLDKVSSELKNNLRTCSLDSQIEEIDANAFLECENLTDIYINNKENSVLGSPWGAPNATVHWQQ